jgi:hypothetical protein
MPISSTRRSSPLKETRTRSDYGSYDYTQRDDRGLRFVAQQKFVSFDHLGQYFAPSLKPALDESPLETENLPGKRGGKRDNVPWPLDSNKRLHAVAEIVRRWEKKMGFAETWKPWVHEPSWVRITAAGLRSLGLNWNELLFPEDRRRLSLTSHTYQVNKRRLVLARGGAEAPRHLWISEREIEVQQSQKENGAQLTHRPDGVMLVQADGVFPFRREGKAIDWIEVRRGQTIAVEVELTRKSSERLGNGIFPSLLEHYDYAWYFCGNKEVYETIVAARRDYLHSADERIRIRILLLSEKGVYVA